MKQVAVQLQAVVVKIDRAKDSSEETYGADLDTLVRNLMVVLRQLVEILPVLKQQKLQLTEDNSEINMRAEYDELALLLASLMILSNISHFVGSLLFYFVLFCVLFFGSRSLYSRNSLF